MLERHIKSPKGGSLISDEDHDNNGETSSEITAGTSSSKENLQCSEDKLPNVKVHDNIIMSDDDDDDHDIHSDDGIDSSKRKSVLEMANAIESSMTISTNEAVQKPSATSDDDDDDANISVSTPPPTTEPQQSQFWSLQAGTTTRRSSITSTISKIKRPPSQPTPPPPEPPIIKTPVPEPREILSPASLLLDAHASVSPVTSPAAIICSIPSPIHSKSSTRTVITRETLEGSGPRVRLTRAELLRQKAKEKKQNKQREETALKPSRTNGFVKNKQPRVSRQNNKDYPKPWLVSSSSDTTKKQTTPPRVRTSRTTSRPQEPRVSTGKEPHINKLPGKRRSRSRPAAATTNQTGKVRLTRAAILKLRQSQEKAATQMTLQDRDNQRLGIPPVKFLQIPNSPTKINFEDDEMEHPNDIARRKLRQLFDDNHSRSTKAR